MRRLVTPSRPITAWCLITHYHIFLLCSPSASDINNSRLYHIRWNFPAGVRTFDLIADVLYCIVYSSDDTYISLTGSDLIEIIFAKICWILKCICIGVNFVEMCRHVVDYIFIFWNRYGRAAHVGIEWMKSQSGTHEHASVFLPRGCAHRECASARCLRPGRQAVCEAETTRRDIEITQASGLISQTGANATQPEPPTRSINTYY